MADDSDLGPFWAEAVKAYERECEKDQEPATTFGDLRTTEDLLNLIEKKSGEFGTFRDKHSKLWSQLKRCTDPIATVGKLVANIVAGADASGAGTPVAVILSSIAQLVLAAKEVTNAYDWIQTVFAELEEFSQRLDSYSKTNISNALKRKIVAILAFVLRIIGRAELLIKRNRFRQYLRVTFIGKDEKTHALVEDLNKLLTNEQRLVVALTYERTEQISQLASTAVDVGLETNDKVSKVDDDVRQLTETVKETVDAVRAGNSQQLDQRLLDNLEHVLKSKAYLSTEDWFALFKRRLLPGSGAWLEKEQFYSIWREHNAPILWIFGGPGAGKTMLSTWLINCLTKSPPFEPSNQSVGVGYFFVKENVEDLRNLNNMFKTMAWQIQQTDRVFKRHAAVVCENDRNIIRAEDTWENIFLKYYQDMDGEGRRAILIIDGLDEAGLDTQRRLLRLLKDYVMRVRSGMPHRIQFAVFGRSTLRPELKRVKLDREEKIIEVSPLKNHEDMSNYISNRLKDLAIIQMMRKKKPGGPEKAKKFARTVRRKALDGASGVFLWAQLLLDQMEGKDEAQINKILANPPQKLDDMIFSVFERLSADDEVDEDTTNKLLMWVAFAKRPLSFGEIDVYLRSSPDQTNWFLWNHLRGKFASIFKLRYPQYYDPEAESSDDEAEAPEASNAPEVVTSGAVSNALEAAVEDDDDFSLGGSSEGEDEGSDDEAEETTTKKETGPQDAGSSDDEAVNASDPAKTIEYEEPKVSDADQHYGWGQKHTVIDFSHQRFRDFLVSEGDSSTRKRPVLPLGIDVRGVETRIVCECLRILKLTPRASYYSEYYACYPSFYMFSHLRAIKLSEISEDHFAEIIEGLYWLMTEEAGCRTLFAALAQRENGECDMFWQLWLANNYTTTLLQTWFKRAAETIECSQEQKDWMHKASTSVPGLLKPLAMTAATIWLKKKGYSDEAYLDKSEFHVMFLQGYRALDETGRIREDMSRWIYARDGTFWNKDAAEIEAIAEWAGFERTTHWYSGLGWIIWETGQCVRAKELCEKAIELDSGAWVALEALAKCIGDYDQDYARATEVMEQAVEKLCPNLKECNVDSYLLAHIARWQQYNGNYTVALRTARKAWENNRASLPAVWSYLLILIQVKDWPTLMYVFEYLQDWDTGYGCTYLVRFLSQYRWKWEFGRACRAVDKPGYMLDASNAVMEQLVQGGDEENIINKLFDFANMRYCFYDQDDEPIRLWEEALSRLSSAESSIQKMYTNHKIHYTNRVAQGYFDIAVQNFKAGLDYSDAVTKLKQLATSTSVYTDPDADIFAYYTTGYPSSLYGRWLRDYEKAAPSVWRKCFRSRLLEQMNGLDDNDPSNDTSACKKLAKTLFNAGDDHNAGVILAVLFKTLEEYIRGKERHREAEAQEAHEGQVGEDARVDSGHNEADSDSDDAVKVNSEDIVDADPSLQQAPAVEDLTLEDADIVMIEKSNVPQASDGVAAEPTQPASASGPVEPVEPVPEEQPAPQPFVGPHVAFAPADAKKSDPSKDVSKLGLELESDAWACRCDGCDQDAEDAGEMWYCEICYDENFCGKCLDKVKNSSLSARHCNPNHKWYKAWPLDQQMVAEMALSFEGGHVELRSEWLEALRSQWLRE